MENKFTVADYKKAVYEAFKDEINLISKNSKREGWQADIGVATDMFIRFVETATADSLFVNILDARVKLADLKDKIHE